MQIVSNGGSMHEMSNPVFGGGGGGGGGVTNLSSAKVVQRVVKEAYFAIFLG